MSDNRYFINRLWFAFVFALLAHVAVLSLKLSSESPTFQNELTINIKLDSNPDKLEETPVDVVEETITPSQSVPTPPKTEPPVVTVDDIIVAIPTADTSSKPKLVLRTDSVQFRRFVEQETQAYQSDNPGQAEKFRQTFEEPVSTKEIISSDNVSAQAQLRATGVFADEDKNGNRRCYAVIENMLDISAAPSYTSQNCTPEKKFDLRLGKPNNG